MTPFQQISIMRPAQILRSNICEFAHVSRKNFFVTVSWKAHPESKKREELSYKLSMDDYHDVSYLGARSPWTQIAEQIKGMREDWKPVARGSRRIQADVHSGYDRSAELKAQEALIKQMQEQGDLAPKKEKGPKLGLRGEGHKGAPKE